MSRWLLILGALGCVLQSTLLFEWVQRTVVRRWMELAEGVGFHIPPFLVGRWFQRAYPLLVAGVFIGIWWFSAG